MANFEASLGLPPGSVAELMFGASYAHGDGGEEEHDFHLLEKGRLSVKEYALCTLRGYSPFSSPF